VLDIPSADPVRHPISLTKALLACGLIAGPLFIVAVIAQALIRAGFDITGHAPSLLSLADVRSERSAVRGVRGRHVARPTSEPGWTWGPLPLGVFGGAALIAAGIFIPDPANGFPPGAAAPNTPTWYGGLHDLSFVVGSSP
jgi:hypothetical protein